MFGANLSGMFGAQPAQPALQAPVNPFQAAPVAPVASANPFGQAPQQAIPAPVAPVAPVAPGGFVQNGPGPQAPAVSGFFSGMEHAKASEGGNYERAGHYIEKINRIKLGRSRKEKDFVVFEKTVVHVYDDAAGSGHKVGEDVSHMVTKTGNEMFFPNMRTYFSALAGCPVEAMTPQIAESIITQRLCDGMYVECANRVVTTKKGGLFTNVTYRKQVTPQELQTALTAEEKARFFPNNELAAAVQANRQRV